MKERRHTVLTADATGGLRTESVNQPSVLVNRSKGEQLFYRVTAEGVAAWVFSCAHRDVIRQSTTEPGHPKSIYEWTMSGGDFDAVDDVYAVMMIFGPADRYRVVTEHRDRDGKLIELLTDLTFEGGSTGDFARDELRVFVL